MKEITMSEFIEDLWNNANDVSPMDIETARSDLNIFRECEWNLPEGITPESYMEAWNAYVKEAGDSDDD